jgi:hypothetical protein
MHVEIVAASPAHIGAVANRMRAADVIECRAQGWTPRQALRLGIIGSDEAFTAKVGPCAHAMFGRVVVSALSGEGTPWFLGSEEVYCRPREMMGFGRYLVDHWLNSTPRLSNVVSASNHRAIRMLEYWGFDIGSDSIVIGDLPFLPFWIER